MNKRIKMTAGIMLIVACMGSVSGCGTQKNTKEETNGKTTIVAVEQVKDEIVKEEIKEEIKEKIKEEIKEEIKEKIKEKVKEEVKEEVEIMKVESDDIDFSNLKYVLAEKERNEKLEAKIKEKIEYNKETDGSVRYFYNNVDLNGDGKEETFVMLIGQAVSGSGGSTAFIFEKDGEDYKQIDKFTLVNNPVIISDEKTNDWNDIIMNVYGGGESFFAKLQYDGEKYPSNPSVQSAVEVETKITGTAIISDEIVFGYGLELE